MSPTKFYIIVSCEAISTNALFIPGSIWTNSLDKPQADFTTSIAPYLFTCTNDEEQDKKQVYDISLKHLQEIDFLSLDLLIAVKDTVKRLQILDDHQWMSEGLSSITVDCVVNVTHAGIECKGIVRFRGHLPGEDGLRFGIELESKCNGRGTTNGSYRKRQYFTCPEDAGIFLSISSIRICKESVCIHDGDINLLPLQKIGANVTANLPMSVISEARKLSVDNSSLDDTISESRNLSVDVSTSFPDDESKEAMDKNIQEQLISVTSSGMFLEEVNKRELNCTSSAAEKSTDNECPFLINDRAVWVSDNGPEFCTVKWLGVLPYSKTNETVVGVEFDNPVGTGTGKYKGHQLFKAQRQHASLIPVLGLMRASDYMEMIRKDEMKYN